MQFHYPPLDKFGLRSLLVEEGPFLTQQSSEAGKDQGGNSSMPGALAGQLAKGEVSFSRFQDRKSNNKWDHTPSRPMSNSIITTSTCSAHYIVSRLDFPFLSPGRDLLLAIVRSVGTA